MYTEFYYENLKIIFSRWTEVGQWNDFVITVMNIRVSIKVSFISNSVMTISF